MLTKSEMIDTLYRYMIVTVIAVSSMLVKKDNGVQRLIYCASKALQDTETKYQKVEKLVYAVVISTRKLRLYFQSTRWLSS